MLTPINMSAGFARDSASRFTLDYERPDPNHLSLVGTIMGDSVRAGLVRREKDFLLQRGFHWINEYPFNR